MSNNTFFYQLPSGKTIQINSLDALLNLDVQAAMASDCGYEINDPFFHSSIQPFSQIESLEDDVFFIDFPEIENIEEIQDEDINFNI